MKHTLKKKTAEPASQLCKVKKIGNVYFLSSPLSVRRVRNLPFSCRRNRCNVFVSVGLIKNSTCAKLFLLYAAEILFTVFGASLRFHHVHCQKTKPSHSKHIEEKFRLIKRGNLVKSDPATYKEKKSK